MLLQAADQYTPVLLLLQVAINNELVLAVSNKNLAWPGGMLESWVSPHNHSKLT